MISLKGMHRRAGGQTIAKAVYRVPSNSPMNFNHEKMRAVTASPAAAKPNISLEGLLMEFSRTTKYAPSALALRQNRGDQTTGLGCGNPGKMSGSNTCGINVGSAEPRPASLSRSLAASLLVPASLAPNPYPPSVLGSESYASIARWSFSHCFPGTVEQSRLFPLGP